MIPDPPLKPKIVIYESMIAQIQDLIQAAKQAEDEHADLLAKVHPAFEKSARNLLHYQAVRRYDIRSLQRKLGHLGLSRLAKAENHVMASLVMTESILKAFVKARRLKRKRTGLSIKAGRKLVNKNSVQLFGKRSKKRRTRIMVTMPSEAATNPQMVEDMLAAGMNTVRINCAHDGPEAWKQMIEHVQLATDVQETSCKISMDLAGPKIRTGAMALGAQVLKIRTQKNDRGELLEPTKIWLSAHAPEEEAIHLTLPDHWVKQLRFGNKIHFEDTRGKRRKMRIIGVENNGVWAECKKTAYVEVGTTLTSLEHASSVSIERLPAKPQVIVLQVGDLLLVHTSTEPGANSTFDEEGNLIKPAHISCTSEEVFSQVKEGERVLFDDGKIEGIIQERHDDKFLVKITFTPQKGGKLRSDKGINFPDSKLKIHGLTMKDRKDLAFVVPHADVVNMSFVNRAEDVSELLVELETYDAIGKIGLILKIETMQGVENMVEILLTAMQTYPVGVMIARGDLAIETGWDNIGSIQEELLWICQAGHIPTVWATQVLENLAKTGLPSRAEITDATMAQRAECVMLNKGPYIVKTIKLLNKIFKKMDAYQEKNHPLTPPLGSYRRWG